MIIIAEIVGIFLALTQPADPPEPPKPSPPESQKPKSQKYRDFNIAREGEKEEIIKDSN